MVFDRPGTDGGYEEYPIRTPEDAVAAVRRLNGADLSQITLVGNGRLMMIAGGNQGRYSAQIIVGKDKAFYTLVDDGKTADRDVEIVTGHQGGMLPERQCVELDFVLEAVREFARSGEPLLTLRWDYEE